MMRPTRLAALLLGIGTVFGLFSFARRYFAELAEYRQASPWPPLVDELTAAWLAMALIGGVVLLARRYPIGPHWWLYVLIAPAYAGLHTLAMFASRSALYPLLGLGPYKYGDLGYRFLMEAPVQLLAYVLTLLIVITLARQRRTRDAERLEQLLTEARLERLRLSMAPHFLFNTLNVISAAAYESPQKADQLIERLAKLLRAQVSADVRQTCTVDEELEILNEYLALQKARFEDDLEVTVDCSAALLRCEIPFMILQPLVENALQHGADPEGRVQLSITVRAEDDELLIIDVNDAGPGPQSTIEGVGVRNTRERIAYLYGPPFGYELIAGPDGGAVARLTLPRRCAS